MKPPIERILSTYRLLKNLSEVEVELLRSDVTMFLQAQQGLDEQRLTVEGLRYLRQK